MDRNSIQDHNLFDLLHERVEQVVDKKKSLESFVISRRQSNVVRLTTKGASDGCPFSRK